MNKGGSNAIRWPRTKSLKELRQMSSKELLRYALRLHKAWAKKHEKDMQWDLFWVEFYQRELRKKAKK